MEDVLKSLSLAAASICCVQTFSPLEPCVGEIPSYLLHFRWVKDDFICVPTKVSPSCESDSCTSFMDVYFK